MADDDDPKAGELVTANYGWTKPTVGSSDDQWGGYLNADLDGIDSVVHGIDTRPAYVLPVASTTVLGGAKVDGTTIHAAPDGTLSGTPSSGPSSYDQRDGAGKSASRRAVVGFGRGSALHVLQ